MNNIITMRRLVEIMAQQSKIPAGQIDHFLKCFTSLIAETLADGQPVCINGVGQFAIAADKSITFKPDENLARDVNSPFDIFEPEQLAEGITVEELDSPLRETSQSEPVIEPAQRAQNEPSSVSVADDAPVDKYPDKPKPEPRIEPMVEPTPEHEPVITQVLKPQSEPKTTPVAIQTAQEPEYAEEKAYDEYADEYSETRFPTFWTLIGLLVGLILGIGIGYFMHDPIEKLLEPSLDEEQVEYTESVEDGIGITEPYDDSLLSSDDTLSQSVEEVAAVAEVVDEKPTVAAEPEKPADQAPAQNAPNASTAEVKYEIVKPGTSLANLAKKYYGERSYWVYIFLENQNVIKNPNRVPQGAKLVIPPLEKYATQSTQAEKLEAARKKVSEVLSEYPN